MTALVYGNGVGYHWKGLYNESLMNTLGKSLKAQAQDLPHQAKFVTLVGSYLNQAYYGRLYAKAQNQRRALQAAYDQVLERFDILVMPTTPDDGPPLCAQYGAARLAAIRLEYAGQHGAV